MGFGVFTVGFILSVQRIVGQSVPFLLRRHTRRSDKPAPFYPAGAEKANWVACQFDAIRVDLSRPLLKYRRWGRKSIESEYWDKFGSLSSRTDRLETETEAD
jgi:hypothetical protein